MERIFVTSDTHFGHANIIKHMRRPFSSVEQMDEALIYAWNQRVRQGDRVYHLGDVVFRGDLCLYLERLNGRIFVCYGNHDSPSAMKQARDEGLLEWCGDTKYLRHAGNRFWLSHYAHRVWPNSHHGSYHCYGHAHGMIPNYNKSMDVGVDTRGDYAPYLLDEIVARLRHKPSSDHHPEPKDLI